MRAATELGLRTAAIYSQEDKLSLHRFKADEAYLVGKDKGPVAAYLDIEGIIATAKEHEVDAIHPGYGFLSENAEFSRACAAAGIVFVGPPPELLESLGDKLSARKLAQRARRVGRSRHGASRRRPGRSRAHGPRDRLPGDRQGGLRGRRARHARRRVRARSSRQDRRGAEGSGVGVRQRAVPCSSSASCRAPGTSRCRCWPTPTAA